MTSATTLLGSSPPKDHTRTYESPSCKRWVAGGVGLTIAVSAIAFMILGCLQPDGFLRSVGTIGNPHSWALWTLVGGGLVIGGTLIAYAIVKRENYHNHAISTRLEEAVQPAQEQEQATRKASTHPTYYDRVDNKVTSKEIPLPSGGTFTMQTIEQSETSSTVNNDRDETLRKDKIIEDKAPTLDDTYHNLDEVKMENLNFSLSSSQQPPHSENNLTVHTAQDEIVHKEPTKSSETEESIITDDEVEQVTPSTTEAPLPSAQQLLRLANNFEELLGDELLKKIPDYPDPVPKGEHITGQKMPQRMLKSLGDGFSFIALKLKCVSPKETIETHVAKTRFIRTSRGTEKRQLVERLTNDCQTQTTAFLLVHYPQKGWRQFVTENQKRGCCLAPSFVFDESRMLVTDKFNVSFSCEKLDELIEQGLVNLKALIEGTATSVVDHNGLEWELASD